MKEDYQRNECCAEEGKRHF